MQTRIYFLVESVHDKRRVTSLVRVIRLDKYRFFFHNSNCTSVYSPYSCADLERFVRVQCVGAGGGEILQIPQ